MSDIEAAAWRLALFTLAFLAVVLFIWWVRRPKAEHAGPKAPRIGMEGGFARLRRKEPDIEEVQIAPARLARVSGSAPLAPLPEPGWSDAPQADPAPTAGAGPVMPDSAEPGPPVADPAAGSPSHHAPDTSVAAPPGAAQHLPGAPAEDMLEAMASAAVTAAGLHDPYPGGAVTQIFAPRIPPRNDAPVHSWIGGRPRLPETMEWPKVDGREGDFLAQISCAALPPMIWDGVGPRSGWLAFFANPDSGAPAVLHLSGDGPPRDPPHDVGALWSPPGPGLGGFARHAFPEWPVEPAGAKIGDGATAVSANADGYDVAHPAFHPFDWDSMTAMIDLLESRLDRLAVDGAASADASDELAQAIADAAAVNRSARARAREIIAVVRESAGQGSFTAAGAAAVMEGLQAVRWNAVFTRADPETGKHLVETLVLPLTRHHPAADLWAGDWRAVLADHAKHAWCADPAMLPEPLRAQFEPEWRRMAAAEAVVMGGAPEGFVPGFDSELDAVLIHLPASALFNRGPASGKGAIVAIRKADLAAGDFGRVRMLRRAD